MKKKILLLLLGVVLVYGCVGCGSENTTTEQNETSVAITTEENTAEQIGEVAEASEETVEQIPEIIEEPDEEVVKEKETAEETPEVATEPTETTDGEQVETVAAETASQYTYTDMSATMYIQQTVNIRDLPDTNGNKIGSLSTNDEIAISGQCNETGWYRFEYNGSVAYVSNKYVGENEVEVQQTPADNSAAGNGSAASNWADSYPKNEWIDMGSYFFYIANSQPEANQVCCDCSQGRFYGEYLWQQELWSRYPDRNVTYFSDNANGVPIAVVCSYYENETNFYRPKYLWETTKLSARVIYVD